MFQQNPSALYTDTLRPASDGGWCGCFTLTRQPLQQCLPDASTSATNMDACRAPRGTAGGAPSRFPAPQHHNEAAADWGSAASSDASPPPPGAVLQHAPLPHLPPSAAHHHYKQQQALLAKLSPLRMSASGGGSAGADRGPGGSSRGGNGGSPGAPAPDTPQPHSPSLLHGSAASKASESGSGSGARSPAGLLPAPFPAAAPRGRGAWKAAQPEHPCLRNPAAQAPAAAAVATTHVPASPPAAAPASSQLEGRPHRRRPGVHQELQQAPASAAAPPPPCSPPGPAHASYVATLFEGAVAAANADLQSSVREKAGIILRFLEDAQQAAATLPHGGVPHARPADDLVYSLEDGMDFDDAQWDWK